MRLQDLLDQLRFGFRFLLVSQGAISGQEQVMRPRRPRLEANRRNLEIAVDVAYKQNMIPRKFTVEELFE